MMVIRYSIFHGVWFLWTLNVGWFGVLCLSTYVLWGRCYIPALRGLYCQISRSVILRWHFIFFRKLISLHVSNLFTPECPKLLISIQFSSIPLLVMQYFCLLSTSTDPLVNIVQHFWSGSRSILHSNPEKYPFWFSIGQFTSF